MPTKLNPAEIQTLMQALDALQEKPTSNGLMMSLLMAGLSKDKEESKNEMKSTMDAAHEEAEKIKETVILLKAKLIAMRDEQTVEEMAEVLRSGQ